LKKVGGGKEWQNIMLKKGGGDLTGYDQSVMCDVKEKRKQWYAKEGNKKARYRREKV